MMNSEESREDMQKLGLRIQSCREIVEQRVISWDATQRQEFFDEFSNSNVFSQLNQVGPDPIARLQLFLSMPETDLEKLMTLQACIVKDAQEGGSLGTQVSRMAYSDGQSSNTNSTTGNGGGGILGGLMSSIGALTGFSSGSGASNGHNHNHNHGHSHSHGHSHDGGEELRSRKAVPVTKGVETMER